MKKLYCEASFFEEEIDFSSQFSIIQEELVFNKILDQKNRKFSFLKTEVKYVCNFQKAANFDSALPTLIIPIRDNSELLSYTIKNIDENNIRSQANIFIVDDRSKEDIRKIAIENSCSYLRVDNEKGFNFSMLNNIAAYICNKLGNSTIVLWNSDLWAVSGSYFKELLNRHYSDNSKLSGTKLVYPPSEKSFSKTEDTKNIQDFFPQLLGGKWREKVQFGGEMWITNPSNIVTYQPNHFKRFGNISDPLVNCDRGSLFVTGALQVIDLKFYIELGGLNPSLSKNYQDVDICLRAYEAGFCPMYYGKDIYFYHDESLTFSSLPENKVDSQLISDMYLFGKLWNDKIGKFLSH